MRRIGDLFLYGIRFNAALIPYASHGPIVVSQRIIIARLLISSVFDLMQVGCCSKLFVDQVVYFILGRTYVQG